jgi:hypothetical protein
MSTEEPKKQPRLMVVVPDGKTAWKEGQLENGIEEHVTHGPCLHISREAADYHMDRVQTLDPETVDLLKVVFPTAEIKGKMSGADSIREYGPGIRHIAGLIDLTLKLNIKHPGITTNWQYPEQLLHPAAALNITDCVMKMIAIIDKRIKGATTLPDSIGPDQNQTPTEPENQDHE